MKTPKKQFAKTHKGSWQAMSSEEKLKYQLDGLKTRKVHETDKYLIAVENRTRPLNFEIYPKRKDGSLMLDEYNRLYTDYDVGKEYAIEIAEYELNRG